MKHLLINTHTFIINSIESWLKYVAERMRISTVMDVLSDEIFSSGRRINDILDNRYDEPLSLFFLLRIGDPG